MSNVIPFETFDTKRRLKFMENQLRGLRDEVLLDLADLKKMSAAAELLPQEDPRVVSFQNDMADLEDAYTSIVLELVFLALRVEQFDGINNTSNVSVTFV